MKILVFNVGSSSVKYKVYRNNLKLLLEGKIDRLKNLDEFTRAFREVTQRVGELEIEKIGHRIVFGGPNLLTPTKINQQIFREIKKHAWVSPIHILPELEILKLSLKKWSSLPQFAVFDSGFFANLPEPAQIFPIPLKFFKKGIKRFGFHGLSHCWALEQAVAQLKSPTAKIISLHLGAGASATAAIGTRPIETSMGLTPLGGLMMQTRPGDLDPGVILALLRQEEMSISELSQLLYKKSGILGIAGFGDFRDLRRAAGIAEDGSENNSSFDEETKKRATLALEMYVWQVRKIVGAYTVLLGGLDCLVFTGAIGYGSPAIRQLICENLQFLPSFKVLTVEPQEELVIAREIASAK